jgi:hypothetical protein
MNARDILFLIIGVILGALAMAFVAYEWFRHLFGQ